MSQVDELRLLEQKRLTAGLTPEEEKRRAALSGACTPAPRGFDVKAAAAQVRALLEPEAGTPTAAASVPSRSLLDGAAALPVPDVSSRSVLGDAGALPVPAADDLAASTPAAEVPPADQGSPWDEAAAIASPDAGGEAPVYDAAAYGLDPDDPNSAAWAAWYAEQGWDPATAYAYAQQLNDQYAQEPSAQASDAGPAADGVLADGVLADGVLAPCETAPELPAADGGLAPEPASEFAEGTAAGSEGHLQELPSEELAEVHEAFPVPGALDGAPQAPAEVAPEVAPETLPELAPEAAPAVGPEVEHEVEGELTLELPPIELEAFDASSAEAETVAPPDAPGPDVPVELGLTFEGAGAGESAPSPGGPWAEHAVPEPDSAVDFTAFDAEPSPATEDEVPVAEATSLWELPAAQPAWAPAPEPTADPSGVAGIAEPAAETAPPLPDCDLVEILDDDVIEVTEVVEQPDPGEPLLPFEAEPAHGQEASAAIDGLYAMPISSLAPDEASPTSGAPPAVEAPAWPIDGAAPAAHELFAQLPPEPEPEAERADAPAPPTHVPGTHRVVVHTSDGQVKRGMVSDLAMDAGEVGLATHAGGPVEPVPVAQIKAIFFMLPPGEPPPRPEGKKVRVTFRDGRQVAGFSADYEPERSGFFMVPADARTHTARIWVYRSAVRQVSVS